MKMGGVFNNAFEALGFTPSEAVMLHAKSKMLLELQTALINSPESVSNALTSIDIDWNDVIYGKMSALTLEDIFQGLAVCGYDLDEVIDFG